MELRHLRYFVTVAELGSVSHAAAKLFIAQPPLSAQIRQLEEEVGASLFIRMPRGVRLTAAGESFLEDARAILARAQQASVRAREWHAGQRSILRLGLMPSTTQSILPGLLKRLHASDLAVQLQAREISPSSRQLLELRNAQIDLGFIRLGTDELPPETVASIDDPYCLAIPAGNPLTRQAGPLALKLASHESFVSFSRHHESDYFDQTAALCVEAGFRPDIRNEAGQFDGVLAMVSCGLGVAIVPVSCTTLAQHKVVFRRLAGSRYRSRLVMVQGKQSLQDNWTTQVAALAKTELKNLAHVLEKTLN